MLEAVDGREDQAVSDAAVSATQPPDPDVIAPRAGEELDAAAVGRYLEGKIPGAEGTPEIWQFPGGHANLTYLVAYPSARYVLRRPPHGDIPASAHDMGREYRVLSVLYKGFPPAPRAFLYCEDKAVIGAPFFVMERKNGVVVRREVPERFGGGKDPVANRKLSTVHDRHAGRLPRRRLPRRRPRDARQARRLPRAAGVRAGPPAGSARRRRTSRSREDVVAWLEAHMPASPAPTLVHNDWRLDNMAVTADDPGKAARGLRLGHVHARRSAHRPRDADVGLVRGGRDVRVPLVHAVAGARLHDARRGDRALRRSAAGCDVSRMPYYYVFGLFKMAVVVQQLYFRWHKGQTKDDRMSGGEAVAEGMIQLAAENIARIG